MVHDHGAHVTRAPTWACDYREDGMDLGSDAGSSSSNSSRASSQSNSTKVTPCSECKSSSSPGGSLDLVSALEDYEEPFPVYQKKVIDEWAPEEDGEEKEEEDGRHERGCRDDRCPARGPGDVSAGPRSGGVRSATTAMPPPVPNGNLHPHDPQDLRHNGNVVVAGRPSGSRAPRRAVQKPQPAGGRRGGRGPAAGGLCLQPTDSRTCVPEEPPAPPMDWEALEKHLAGLQFREQEVRNQGQARTNSTSLGFNDDNELRYSESAEVGVPQSLCFATREATASGKEPTWQCKRLFTPAKIPWTEEPGGLCPGGCKQRDTTELCVGSSDWLLVIIPDCPHLSSSERLSLSPLPISSHRQALVWFGLNGIILSSVHQSSDSLLTLVHAPFFLSPTATGSWQTQAPHTAQD
ncbi:hypothetical protein FD755_014117 [Muntiacus reevesi]|uniref:Schwannomin interacting protein 1 C-terminal domain-containing protein n=1 Tax=Muntiacus reevesi TaxID=9886 RepID=A0A5N3XIW9_MUNRE|nr:hypothetical protein FD755_014117 [Muntiacus reevesi]